MGGKEAFGRCVCVAYRLTDLLGSVERRYRQVVSWIKLINDPGFESLTCFLQRALNRD